MKYIKYFENKDLDRFYYIVPADDRLKDSLEKIGCDKHFINLMLGNSNIKHYKFIFIGYTPISGFGWNAFLNSSRDDFYEETYNCKFGGYINMTEDEITKIELLDVVKKYNL